MCACVCACACAGCVHMCVCVCVCIACAGLRVHVCGVCMCVFLCARMCMCVLSAGNTRETGGRPGWTCIRTSRRVLAQRGGAWGTPPHPPTPSPRPSLSQDTSATWQVWAHCSCPSFPPRRPALYPAVAGRRGGRAGGGPTSSSCLPSPQPASQASRLLESPGRPVPLPNSTIYRPQRRGALGGPRPAGPSQRRSMRTPWGWGRSIPGRGRTGCAGQK